MAQKSSEIHNQVQPRYQAEETRRLSGVPAGKLIKIDSDILDVRLELQKKPDSAELKAKMDALLKEREAIILSIQQVRPGEGRKF